MLTAPQQPEAQVAYSPRYWNHKIGEPTGPVAQFRMAQLIDYDRRLTEPSRVVYRFMIGWYMADKGDALASVRHIVATMRARAPEGAKHLSRSAVQRAIILLIDNGWLVRRFTGKGRSGSRYVPVLNVLELAAQGTLPSSVPEGWDANGAEAASRYPGTPLSHSTGTQTDLASQDTGTKTLLPNPATDRVTERDNDCAAPLAPLSVGLEATATGAQGFEKLWLAYGHRQRKAEARAAFNKLVPQPELVDQMVEAATAWRARWAAQNKPDAPRYTLARWIESESYDCDPPLAFQPRATRSAAADNGTAAAPRMVGSINPFSPYGTFRAAEITETEVTEAEGEKTLRLDISWSGYGGPDTWHEFVIGSPDADLERQGQAMVKHIAEVLGLSDFDGDIADLTYRPFTCTIAEGLHVSYAPYAANDNEVRAAA